jgi:hypothetical protein
MVAGFGLFHRERSVTGPHPRRYATPPPPSNEWERGPGGICVNLRDKRPSFLKNGFGRTIVQLPEQHQEQ